MAKPILLLLPPGGFSETFFDYYKTRYANVLDNYQVMSARLPSHFSMAKNAISKDAKYIDELINKQTGPLIAVGISTSAASLLEALKLSESSHLKGVILVFPGEFISHVEEPWVELMLKVINSNSLFRGLFYLRLKMMFTTYQRDKKLRPANLLHFYKDIIYWQYFPPKYKFKTPALILHATKDALVDITSRQKVEDSFTSKEVIYVECNHEPSDAIAEILFKTLESHQSQLLEMLRE